MKDLFEFPEHQPKELRKILDSWNPDEDDYIQLEDLLKKVEKVGFTFDYYLDGVPYNLRKIKK